jgi:hypothetical protein
MKKKRERERERERDVQTNELKETIFHLKNDKEKKQFRKR